MNDHSNLLIYLIERAQWNHKRPQVVDGLREDDQFYKRGAAGHRYKFSIPRGELADTLVFKVLKSLLFRHQTNNGRPRYRNGKVVRAEYHRGWFARI
jgi:hypothetical protein